MSLHGRLGHPLLEAAVDAVRGGQFPGWQLAYEHIGVEMVRGQVQPVTIWLDSGTVWLGSGVVGEALTPSMAETPTAILKARQIARGRPTTTRRQDEDAATPHTDSSDSS